MCLVMVLAAFTALTLPLTFDVWEATRISPHDF
jgi:hypothetical protein